MTLYDRQHKVIRFENFKSKKSAHKTLMHDIFQHQITVTQITFGSSRGGAVYK